MYEIVLGCIGTSVLPSVLSSPNPDPTCHPSLHARVVELNLLNERIWPIDPENVPELLKLVCQLAYHGVR